MTCIRKIGVSIVRDVGKHIHNIHMQYISYILYHSRLYYTQYLEVREQGRDEVVHRMPKMAEKSGSGQGLRTHVPQSLQSVRNKLDLNRGRV